MVGNVASPDHPAQIEAIRGRRAVKFGVNMTWLIAALLVLIAAALMIVVEPGSGVAKEQAIASDNPLSGDEEAIQSGRKLCTQCHGAAADGIAPRFGKYSADLRKFNKGFYEFAGIVVVSVPDGSVPDLTASLDALNLQGLLDVRVAIAAASDDVPDAAMLQLRLVGQDRPGIIREISAALASRDVSIVELETNTTSAPMSGEPLFEAVATLRIPPDLDHDDLRHVLEDIANEMMVDLEFGESSPTTTG